MKSKPITSRAKNSPLKVGEEKKNSSSSSSTSYEADASGNVFKVERQSTASDALANQSEAVSVPKAKSGGSKATDTGKYIAGLKKRFPNATGQELKDKGYISGAYVDQFPAAQASSNSSTQSSNSETRTPVMRPAVEGNKGMETDTRWNWQQKNINRTQNSQERQNRREARKSMKYMESEGLVQKTGKIGRGKGYELTEAGKADANAQTMFKENKRDIFGADRQRFSTDESGNVTGRNEAYDVQDSRKNRAQTGSYDPHDTYRAAKPEEQWNVGKHGEYGGGTTSSSSSDTRAESSTMFNGDAAAEARQAEQTINLQPKSASIPQPEASMEQKPVQAPEDNSIYAGGDLNEVTVTSSYAEPDFSEKPILGSEAPSVQHGNSFNRGMEQGFKESVGPKPTSYKSHGNMEQVEEETPLQMKYKHNPRMMYGDSPAKMWGAEKVQAQSKIIGDFKSSTAGKPITKAASGPFKMKGYNK